MTPPTSTSRMLGRARRVRTLSGLVAHLAAVATLVALPSAAVAISPPFLVSPPPGATIPGTTVTFSWATSFGAVDYRLVIALDPGFTDVAYDEWLGGPDTFVDIVGFPDDGTYYYWQAAAMDSAGNVSWSVVSWFLNGSPPSDAPTLLSPGNGSKVNGTAAALQWSPVDRADDYYVQVALDAAFTAVVYGQWLGNYVGITLTNLPDDGTRYFWRVAAGNATGEGPFSGSRSFVNGPSAVPETPTPQAPGNGANAGGTVVSFRWSQAARATNYYLEVALDAGFTADVYAAWVGDYVGLDLTGFPDNGTQYWWRVAAGNSLGSSPFSGALTLVNGPSGEPDVPLPTSPPNGSNAGGTGVSFGWNEAARAANYYFELALDPGFVDVVFADWIGNYVGINIVGLPDDGTQFWWRVAGGNALGAGLFSPSVTFTNGPSAVPDTPTPTSPANFGNAPGDAVALRWSEAARADDYYVEVALDAAFTQLVFAQWIGNYIGITLSPFADDGTQYFWRVAAGNVLGSSSFSSTLTFINGPSNVPGAPLATSPGNGQLVPGTAVTFLWDAAPRGADYLFEIAYDAGFTEIGFSEWIGNFLGIQIIGFPDDGSTFYWRVKARNVLGEGPFTPALGLVNGPSAAPGPTTPIAPQNGAVLPEAAIAFGWQAADRAAEYYFELATDIGFANVLVAEYTPFTGILVSGFPDDGSSYAWRVRGVNPLGSGPVSPVWMFTNGGCVSGPRARAARAATPCICDPKAGTGHGIFKAYSHVDSCQDSTSGLFYLNDFTREANVDLHGHHGAMPDGETIATSDYSSGLLPDADNVWNAPAQAPGVDAHVNAASTYDYVLQVLSLNGIDGAGRSMKSLVQFPFGSNNAAWDGSKVVYFVGSGQPSYAAALDVAGHEWGHAITELAPDPMARPGSLADPGEPGALNEAFSDWLGTAIEQTTYPPGNWTVGEAVATVRSLQNPRLFGGADAYLNSSRGWRPVTPPCQCAGSPGGNDCCGVHANSGVGDLMFYLLSAGGSPPSGHPFANVVVQGQGIRKAIQIALFANLNVWQTLTNYPAARQGMVAAAKTLYGADSAEVFAVQNAWSAVGVGQLPKITVQVNPPGAGTVTGAGTYLYGANVTVTATPIGAADMRSAGTPFSCWSDIGTVVSMAQTYSFTMAGPRVLVANFGTCSPPPTTCRLDVDSNGRGDVATDLVYITRRLRGLVPVPSGFRALDAGIPDDTTVAARVDAIRAALDVDGNGVTDPARDVLYISRRLLGLSPVPPSLRALDHTIPPDATVAANVDALCP